MHTVRAEAAAAAIALQSAVVALGYEEEGVAAPLDEAFRIAAEGYEAGNLGLAELLIDVEEDRVLRAVLVGMLGEGERRS